MLKNILTIEGREHVINNYQNHINIFTDGSVNENIKMILIVIKLAKQGAMKKVYETSYSNPLLSSYETISILEKNQI